MSLNVHSISAQIP